MAELPDQLVIGEILRPHGLRGELRMRVLSQYPQHLKSLRHVYLADGEDGARARVEVGGLRFNKAYALLKIAGVSNRNQAEELRGKLVICDIKQLPPLEDGEYFLFQLVGMRVVADGADVGKVREALETGANDVYIIDSEEHGELLVPAHDETIDNIDFERGVIEMTLPEGLIPRANHEGKRI